MKRALVLAGGGSRGSYQIGVWKALRQFSWKPDIVTGCSVGAIIGAAVVCDRFDEAVDIFSNITQGSIVKLPENPKNAGELRRFLTDTITGGGMDVSPLENMIRALLDEDKMRKSGVGYGLVTVRRADMKPLEITLEQIPEGKLVDYILASAAVFPAFRARKLDDGAYIDGGFYDNLPLDLAEDMGAGEATAIDLHGMGLKRDYTGYMSVRYIQGFWPLGNHLKFSSDVARRNINLGYLDGLKAFGEAEGRAYAFQKGDLAAFLEQNEGFCNRLGAYFKVSPVAARGAKSGLLKHADYRRAARGMLRAFCEMAGVCMGASPERLYSLGEFNAQLLESLAAAPRPDIALGALRLSRAEAVAAIFDDLVGERRKALSSLAVARPNEYAAACYLAALYKNK